MGMIILPYQLKKQIREIKENYFIPSLNGLKGNVLEIGYGTGDNLQFYNYNECTVYAIDKSDKSSTLKQTVNQKKGKLLLQKGNAEKLHFQNEFFDTVISSFVLCSVDSVSKAIQEITRVLKSNGKLILLEHIKSDNKYIILTQEVLTKIQNYFSIDCHFNRDPRKFIKNDTFDITKEKIFPNALEPYLYLEAIKR